MTKHSLADVRDVRPHRPKSARHNRLSSPASGASASPSSTTSQEDHQTAAEKRAAEVMARYNEVNLLFNNHFPGAQVSGANHHHHHQLHPTASPQPLASGGGHAFGRPPVDDDDDDYDADRELAFELNAAMGLVRHLPTRTTPANLPAASVGGGGPMTYPWLGGGGGMPTSTAAATMPIMPIAEATGDPYNEFRTGAVDDVRSMHGGGGGGLPSTRSPPLHGYPFTSPTAGELMVTASPPDAASYTTRSPPAGSSMGDAVEDLGWLGDSLQRNARMQLQELNEGAGARPYVS